MEISNQKQVMNDEARPRLSRRELLQWFAATAATLTLSEAELFSASPAAVVGKGYGTDPDLTRTYKPGDVWPLTLDAAQRGIVTTLCDLLLPADQYGPAASAVGVPEFIDEWVSAPYPIQMNDRPLILEGIAWLENEAKARFSKGFELLSGAQLREICDDICDARRVKPEWRTAAQFFLKMRSLAAGSYFSTPPGWQAIGYIGNTPMLTFEGPPKEVLDKLGVEQTV